MPGQEDFAGIWKDRHGNSLVLHVSEGAVTGYIDSACLETFANSRFDVVGQASDEFVIFAAVDELSESVFMWIGKHAHKNGRPGILMFSLGVGDSQDDIDTASERWLDSITENFFFRA